MPCFSSIRGVHSVLLRKHNEGLMSRNYTNLRRNIVIANTICFGLCYSIMIAKADTPTHNHSCRERDRGELRTMKGIKDDDGTILVKFKKDCTNDVCMVHAQLDNKTNIATFVLDPLSCFTICDEVKEFDTETKPQGCAKHATLDYQYVGLNDDVWTGSAIIFETVQVDKSDGRVCSRPDFNDGPALATFVSTYEITPQTTVYVYELDGYRTIQEAIDAKPKYITETTR